MSDPLQTLREAREALHGLHLDVDPGLGIVENVMAKCEAAFALIDQSPAREALEKIATSMSSDWPERCIENVRIARRALAAMAHKPKSPG